MSDRYQVKPIKTLSGPQRYEIWDTVDAKPLSAAGNDMRQEQAEHLAEWLNRRDKATGPDGEQARDSGVRLNAVQREIARRVAVADVPGEVRDVGVSPVVNSRPGTRATGAVEPAKMKVTGDRVKDPKRSDLQPYADEHLKAYHRELAPLAEDVRYPEWALDGESVIEVRPDGSDEVVALISFPDRPSSRDVSAVKVGRYLFIQANFGHTSKFAEAYGIDNTRTYGRNQTRRLPRAFFTDLVLFGAPGKVASHLRRWASVRFADTTYGPDTRVALQRAADEIDK